jgi:arylsulfatase A-like enzyme
MNILVIFIDMYRADFFDTGNLKNNDSPVVNSALKIKGTHYNNIYTHCPDTARSFSTFLTGKPCYSTTNNKTNK